MGTLRFDLNDIVHEPSDEELASLMEAVAEEARRRDKLVQEQMIPRLRLAIEEALRTRVSE